MRRLIDAAVGAVAPAAAMEVPAVVVAAAHVGFVRPPLQT